MWLSTMYSTHQQNKARGLITIRPFEFYIQYEDGKKLSFIDKALLSWEVYFLINELVRQT